MNVALPIINVEAPQEAGEEVEEDAAEVIAKPRLEEVREWAPHEVRQEGSQHNAIVQVRVLDEQPRIFAVQQQRCCC